MAEQVGPARCKADILHGPVRVLITFGPPRADSMMARSEYVPRQRPDLRVHPTRSPMTRRLGFALSSCEHLAMWNDSG